MRRLFAAAALAFSGLLIVSLPASAQSGHRHGHQHGHAHDDQGRAQAKRPLYKAAPAPHDDVHAHGVETEGLFAFVDGSDIGVKGERHFTFQLDGAFKKHDGTFRAITPKVELSYNPADRLHIGLEFWGDRFKVQNNSDFDDQNRWGGGVALEFKAVLAKRGEGSPFGMALVLAPHFSTSEPVSGEPARHYALEVKLITDVELVTDKVFAAFNLLYEPERVRPRGEEWEKESLFGASAGIMTRLSPALFAGGEIQYFRKYEGYFFNEFAGQALYVGPALHMKFGEQASLSLGWAVQVAGKAEGDPRSLDLVNFERHRGTFRYSAHF